MDQIAHCSVHKCFRLYSCLVDLYAHHFVNVLQQIVTLAKLRRPPVNIRVPIMAQSADRRSPVTTVDLTPNEYSGRARLVPNQNKFMNRDQEATLVSSSVQEKPSNDGVGAIPATSPKNCNVPAPDAFDNKQERVKTAPEIIEIDD
jgi:hypothetical protein